MHSDANLTFIRTKGSIMGRILMGLLFFVSGLLMLLMQGPAAVGGYFESLGLPVGILFAWIAIVVKVVAGGAIILGKRTTEAAASLIIFTLIATVLAHLSPVTDSSFPNGLLKNLAIVGGLLYLMAFGPKGTNIIGDDPWEKNSKAV